MMLTFIIIHGELDMYSNEFVWYFHHLHEANVRTVRPSIYPCNYKSFPLLISLFSFPLHALPTSFLFWSFLSHLPFFIFFVCDECMKKRYQSYLNLLQQLKFDLQKSKNILLSKKQLFYFLTLLFSELSKILKPEKLLNYNI